MGKLFDFIKQKYQNLIEFQKLQKDDYIKSRNFNNYLQPRYDLIYFSRFITSLNNKFEANLKNNDIIAGGKIAFPSFKYELPNYEEILYKLEENLTEEQVDRFINDFKQNLEKSFGNPSHPFEKVINKLKNDLDEIELSDSNNQLDIKDTKKALDFANEMIVEKHDSNHVDFTIDEISNLRDAEARNRFPLFAKKSGINLNTLKAADNGINTIRIKIMNNDEFDKLKPAMKLNINLSDDYKKKILALDNFISNKSIMKASAYGESDYKEYGFTDWFNKTRELKNEIILNNSLNDKNAKIESYKRICNLSNDLNRITNEYKDVLNFIKDNFDINKIGLPSNIYSGRPQALTNDDLNGFNPNLIAEFDNQNAPYGVILNGYSQLKGFAKDNGIELEEFLNDPVNSYFKGCNNFVKKIDESILLPKEENSLGKRMAHLLLQPSDKYSSLNKLGYSFRSLDFLVQTQDFSENVYDNLVVSSIASKMIRALDHSSINLFNETSNNNDNLKNLFALGEKTDNLFKLSNEYRDLTDDNLNMKKAYDEQIEKMKNVSPKDECNRIMGILKDYFIERKILNDNKDIVYGDDLCVNNFEPGRMITAAKEYFDDYIYKNEIDINTISNKEDRQMVESFITNPVLALANKYSNEKIFVEDKKENFNVFNKKFVLEWRRLHDKDYNKFIENFNSNNNGKYNADKDIKAILDSNKGSWCEKLFKTTSPEYKSLSNAIIAATSENSPTRGDFNGVKYYAKKYLDYKLSNKNENKISETGRRRMEFCRTILKSFDELDVKYKEVEINLPFQDKRI